MARLYLGLTLLRDIKGIYDSIEYFAADNVFGPYWDPGRQISGDIQRAAALDPSSPELVDLAQKIGKSVDEEGDRARRNEARSLFGRGGDS